MKTQTTPAVVPTTSAPVPASGFTLGLDLGDCQHHVCVVTAPVWSPAFRRFK